MFSIFSIAMCLGALYLLHTIKVERKLSDIPGPFLARFTDYWKVYHLLKGDYGECLHRWHQRHGRLIRTGPNIVSVGDPDEVVRVYQTNPLLWKGNMYKGLVSWFKGKNVAGLEGILDETEHARVKRAVAPSFAWKSVLNYESHIDRCAEELIERVESLGTFELTEWFSYWAIDSMNNIAFSTDLGFMRHGKDVGDTLKTVRSFLSIWMYTYGFPQVAMWFAWAVSHIVGPSGPLVSLCIDRVNSRPEMKEKAIASDRDLLDVYLNARAQQPKLFPHDKVLGMTLTTMITGSDTTAYNMTWTVYYLLKNPACLSRQQQEVDDAVLNGTLSYPPTLEELTKLPYLEAVIKEGLRYAVLDQLSMDRVVPKGGMEFCGHFFPEGTTVGCHQRVIHLDQGVYGEDAATFRPERWLEASEETRKRMERCGLWFGSGKHMCIGQNFARAMMMKVLVMMLMKLEIKDADPTAVMTSKPADSMRGPGVPYYMRVTKKRPNSPSL